MDDEAKAKIAALERKIDILLSRPSYSGQSFCAICGKVIDPTEGQSRVSMERTYYLTGSLQPRHPTCH